MAQRRRTREDWQRLVEGWPRSGLTQAPYCERQGVSVGSFYRWHEQLRGGSRAGERVAGAASPVLRLLPVELLADAAALALVLGERLRLQIAPGFDAPTLQRVVALLREGCAMMGLGAHTRVYLAAGATDMRKQIDGLAALVVEVLAAIAAISGVATIAHVFASTKLRRSIRS